jgi:Holliday junction resolvase RusA-like endonuclease
VILLILKGPPQGKHAPVHAQGRFLLDKRDEVGIGRWRRKWQDEGAEVLEGPVEVRILVEAKRPPGHWRRTLDEAGRPQLSADGRRAEVPPTVDVDNVAKLVLDALKGHAFGDDRKVARLEVVKVWAPVAQTTVAIYAWSAEARASNGFRVVLAGR